MWEAILQMVGSQVGKGEQNQAPQLSNLFPDEPAAGGIVPTGQSNTNQLTPQGLQMMQQGGQATGQGVNHILNYIKQQRELRKDPMTQPQTDPNESPWQMMA